MRASLTSLLITLSISLPASRAAEVASLTVRVDRPGHAVSPMLYGIFFEEINRAGDGGLYAEMIQNRSFEDADEPVAWRVVKGAGAEGTAAVDRSTPLNDLNPRSLHLKLSKPGEGGIRAVNEGFEGISVRKGEAYTLTLHARGDVNAAAAPPKVWIESKDGRRLAAATVGPIGRAWNRFEVVLRPTGDEDAARLVIEHAAAGSLWLDVVSMMPAKTWKGRGLRQDLAERLADLRPAFVRFPGGCWVEGETLENAYRWKQTIGDVTRRRNQVNLWKYHSTHGLGFHEYLQLCEDLGAEPLFVVNCGMSHRENVPIDQMGPWVQDALDAVEYANGPADGAWGALRAKAGHPRPFNLKYVQIGNENGGPEYDKRYAMFYDAIRAQHPDVHVVANLWQGVPVSRPIEILDEHYYNGPGFFIANADRYDGYDRKGPKIYVGEYAVTRDCGTGNLKAAVAEAAFMTGIERNSDVVVMASYAPLLANVHYKAWNPNAINFDASRSYGTPSYYVQKLFAEHRPDVVLPVEAKFPTPDGPKRGGVGVGTWITQAEFRDLKVTRGSEVLFQPDFDGGLGGLRSARGSWAVADGALRQTGDGENAVALLGDPAWSDYTYTLRARKLGGSEGFLIPFHVTGDGNYSWWNLGGWKNTKHAVEVVEHGATGSIAGNEVPGRIEAGRWYDVRIEVSGRRVKCSLDGELLHDFTYPQRRPLYAVAGRRGGEVIVKVVNVSPEAHETELRLAGASPLPGKARVVVLTSDKPEDENSLDRPTNVAPVGREVDVQGAALRHTFPPHSVTVLRVNVAE